MPPRLLLPAAALGVLALASTARGSGAALGAGAARGAGAALGAALGAGAAPPPRVVLIVLGDDVGHASAGWSRGSPAATAGPGGRSLTPRLDALAGSGAILDNAVSAFWCTPARSALLSGRLPMHVQQGQDFPETQTAGIPRNMTTLATYFKRANYTTHVVGKWDGEWRRGGGGGGGGADTAVPVPVRCRC